MMRDNEYINLSKSGDAHKNISLNIIWLLFIKILICGIYSYGWNCYV